MPRTRGPWDNIWAAGDCTETVQLATGRPYWVSLATVANKQGRVAGTNLAGGDAVLPGTYGTTMAKVGRLEVGRTGVGEAELTALEVPFITAKANARTHPPYHPSAAPITVKLIAEPGSGRLLGGQIVGGPGSAQRINILATALQAGMSADELAALDLGYAPPFSSVWDPILLAARNLCAKC
jgi:NADPH-dependent 2,4-dienoyl-CoA reductase/sulfur reductase-like enzyme